MRSAGPTSGRCRAAGPVRRSGSGRVACTCWPRSGTLVDQFGARKGLGESVDRRLDRFRRHVDEIVEVDVLVVDRVVDRVGGGSVARRLGPGSTGSGAADARRRGLCGLDGTAHRRRCRRRRRGTGRSARWIRWRPARPGFRSRVGRLRRPVASPSPGRSPTDRRLDGGRCCSHFARWTAFGNRNVTASVVLASNVAGAYTARAMPRRPGRTVCSHCSAVKGTSAAMAADDESASDAAGGAGGLRRS